MNELTVTQALDRWQEISNSIHSFDPLILLLIFSGQEMPIAAEREKAKSFLSNSLKHE